MAKKSKLATPDWILEGYDSKADYEKAKGIASGGEEVVKKKISKKKSAGKINEKKFKIKVCPKCGSDDVGVVVGEDVKGLWKCNVCGWKGEDIKDKEISEEEFLAYTEKMENKNE